jgi:hypothetical protein
MAQRSRVLDGEAQKLTWCVLAQVVFLISWWIIGAAFLCSSHLRQLLYFAAWERKIHPPKIF